MTTPMRFEDIVLKNLVTVRDLSIITGYSIQYIRRLMRLGKLKGIKVGQLWLVDVESFNAFMKKTGTTEDQRFGPKQSY